MILPLGAVFGQDGSVQDDATLPVEEGKKKYPLAVEEGGEAPAHIFDLDIGGVGTDIFWEGYWRYSLTYGTGYEINEGDFIYPQTFPGFRQGFEFSQEPDFFLSVLLLDHFFLETSFTEGYDRNTYVMGYVGDDTTTVKEVRIGNAGIGIGEYTGIDVSSPQYNTPGIKAAFETTRSEHEIMVRYDPTELEQKEFIGEYEIDGETLELPEYRVGQKFILPNTNISNLVIYIESSTGELTGSDGRRYTKRNIAYKADLSEGFITLQNPAEERVLVYYTSGGNPVGSSGGMKNFIMSPDLRDRPDPSGTLLPFAWDQQNPYDLNGGSFAETSLVQIEGVNALMVHNKNEFSNFQMYNQYLYYKNLPEESWRTIVSLVDSEGLTDGDLPYVFLKETDELDNRILTVVVENTDARSPWNRVPFAQGNPEIYGPGRVTDGDDVSREILIAVKKDSSNYYLGTNLISGSVKVYVNGVEDKSVSVDYDTGEVFFSRYIFPEDRINITYRTESSGLTGGDLFLAQGNRLFLSDKMTLELAESLRWTLPESQMTEESGESPGLIQLAGTWFYDSDRLDLSVSTGLNISTSDTAGNLRLLGMEESGFTFSVTEDQVVPSELVITPSISPSLDPLDRKSLLYRDFEMSNNTGQTYLNSYSWSGADIDSSREGPSVASSKEEDPFSSRVMVMSYDLGTDQWSAGDYLPVDSGLVDLSGYSELSFYLYRQNVGEDNLHLELRAGENGESSDLDENGSVDAGDSRFLLTRDLTSQIPSFAQTWKKVSIRLTESERKRLSRVRSLRFILTSPGGSSQGELLAGGFRGEGSPLQLSIITSAGLQRDAENLDVSEWRDDSLVTAFPEVKKVFHPDGDEQKVLRLSWGTESQGGTALNTGDTISGTSWFNSIPSTDYGEMNLYVRNQSSGGTGTFSVTDNQGKGIIVEYTPGSDEWEKLTVDLRHPSASFSGDSRVTSLTIDKETSEFSRFNMTRSGVTSGIMMMDEIHFSDPSYSTGTSVETTLDYTLPGVLAETAGGFPLLADFDVKTRLNYSSQNTDSYFNKEANRVESQLSSGVDVMNVRLQGDFELIWTSENTRYSGGHLVRVPSKSKYGWVSDSYSRSFYPGEDFMSRSNVLHLTPFSFMTMETEAGASGSSGEIIQNWGALINLKPEAETTVNLESDLYQSSDWSSDSTDYGTDWSRDFRYFKPLESGINSREELGSLRAGRTPLPVGFTLETRLEYEAVQQLVWQQQNRWYSDLSFPVKIESTVMPWTITPGYRRELTQMVYPDHYRDFSADLQTMVTTLESQWPLVNFIPYYEIFGRDNMGDFEKTLTMTDDSEYKPEAYIDLTRLSGSRISDLFVPSGLDFAVKREYYKKQDSLYLEHEWTFQIMQSALNLFGDWGSHPLFKFYNTDEWSSSLQLILGGRDLWTPVAEEIIYQNYVTLMGESDWEFVLDNKYTKKWTENYVQDDFQLIFRWFEPELPYFSFPFVDYLVMKPTRMQHEEKLIFTGYFDDDAEDQTSFDTTLKHESKLVITGLGSIKGWMALGLGGKQEVFRNGYELGLELELTF